MTHQFVLSRWRVADGGRMSDLHFGMLLDALQFSSEITESPERFRDALALVERADRGPHTSRVPASRRGQQMIRVA
jgi:hypothetical protein